MKIKKLSLMLGAFIAGQSVQATSWQVKTAGATAVAGVMAALSRYGYNFAELRAIQMRGRTSHILFGDAGQDRLKLYNWKRGEWSSARSILENREAVKRELCSAVLNGDILLVDIEGNVIQEPTWGNVAELIEIEKEELSRDLRFLEEKHLVYYRFLSPLMDPRGILHDIKNACRAEGIDPYGLAGMTHDEEQRLEARMIKICQCKGWHIFRPNYGKASRIYWREYKLYMRLEALKRIVDDMNAGNDMLYQYVVDKPEHQQVWVHDAY